MCTYWEGKGKPKIAAVYRDADAKDLQSRAHNLLSKYRYFSTEKVPDSVENAEVFERYVRRRKKAYEAWMAEDFAYLSTTVVKDEEDSVEGKHYRYRRVYIEEYDVYWEFAIVNEPEITKNCLISIYTAEPEERLFFFIRSLKFI